MCKYVLLILVFILVALLVVAGLVVQEYGWPGFLVFLGALVVVGYVIRKLAPRVFMYLLTRPMRKMGAVLRGARIVVHSVTPTDPPPPDEYDPDEDNDDADAIEYDRGDDEESEEEEEMPAGPLDWYWIEFTVVPPGEGSSEGRIVTRPGWIAPMIGAVGPRPAAGRSNPFGGWPQPGQFPWTVEHGPPEVWNGYEYDLADETLYGEQRLRLRVGVARAVRAVTLTYAHFTELADVRLPRIDVSPGDES